MAVRQLNLTKPLPNFDIPPNYKKNIWNIMDWDIYKLASTDYQGMWKARSSAYDYKLDFTYCNNLYIREEMKYVCWNILFERKVCLRTFAEYYDKIKVLFEYVNIYMIRNTTLLELTDINSYCKFLSEEKNIKIITQNGSQRIGTKMEKAKRRSRYITFIELAQSIIKKIYDANIPEMHKIIWDSNNLPCKSSKSVGTVRLDFTSLAETNYLSSVQDFCKFQLSRVNIKTISKYLGHIKEFCSWLNSNTHVSSFKDLDRDAMEDYFVFLRTQSGFSANKINTAILDIKVFLEWGQLLQRDDMPQIQLILENDYVFKVETTPKYVSSTDMKKIVSLIPQMPSPENKMIYCLLNLGMRCSELSYLPISALHKNDDGSYCLIINEEKVKETYRKPISENIALIMKNEIERNKKIFGEENVKYIFVNKDNTPILLQRLNTVLNETIIKNDVRGEDGILLHVTTHAFRAFVATRLVNAGTDPNLAAKLLGQNTLAALSSYVTITSDTTKEYLMPRLNKIDLLIANMGKVSSIDEENYPKRPLCNGFCGKHPLTKPCAHANACFSCSMFIPGPMFLNKYYYELDEIRTSIKMFEAEGYGMMVRKLKQEEVNLEKIIKKLESKKGE